ncbi:MAG: CRISPR-associated protein (cas_TM1802) [Syntrophorhabdaceae bacterium PtaU1.Bin034]|nr:MAG: CRISPR-associated protein (cas_TM1802) [Syntrophorhabdaceae bacterium PtaU1.Bin034]
MLSAIREIGRLVVEQVINPAQSSGGKIITIVLDEANAALQEVGIEDFDPEKANRYLHTDRGSKGNAPAPFAPLTEAKKTLNKIRTWLSGCEKVIPKTAADCDLVNTINRALGLDDPILKAVDAAAGLLQKKDRKFLTVKLEGGKTFLGDYEVFRKAVAYFADRKAEKSCSTGCACSICGKIQEKVSARTLVYGFDTDDKPGFIAGGFDKTQNWRNIPVCSECRTFLTQGRKFIDSRLNFKFYGLNHCLIPQLLVGNADVLEDIINILSDSHKSVSLRHRIKRRLTDDENEILEFLSGSKDNMTLNFLFLQKSKSAERITLLIEDVFPSRIRAIFEARDHVDSVFSETYNFGKIRTFFSKSDPEKRSNDLNKYFLEIVDAVFRGKWIDFSFLTRFHMDVIRRGLVKDEYFAFRVGSVNLTV